MEIILVIKRFHLPVLDTQLSSFFSSFFSSSFAFIFLDSMSEIMVRVFPRPMSSAEFRQSGNIKYRRAMKRLQYKMFH